MAPHQILVLRPEDAPLTTEGVELPPYVYLVTSGTLFLTQGTEYRTVGEGMVVGLELLTIAENDPLPLARFTARADPKACTLSVYARIDAKANVSTDPGSWIAHVIHTTQVLSRFTSRQSRISASQAGGHLDRVQRALASSERRIHVILHLAGVVYNMLKPLAPWQPKAGEALELLGRMILGERVGKDAIAENLKDYLVEHVVPLLLLHNDIEDVETALYYLGHILPGRIRTQSGLRPKASEDVPIVDDRSERITPKHGQPAIKAG